MSRHHMVDLSNYHHRPNSLANRINDVPGLKTSAAFFTFLRANLALPPSAMSSNVNTPVLEPQTTLPPPSPIPSPLAQSGLFVSPSASSTDTIVGPIPDGTLQRRNSNKHRRTGSIVGSAGKISRRNSNSNDVVFDDDSIPPLSLDILTERSHRAEALRLIADSIAQQRQRAALTLVFHPLCLAALALCLTLVYRHSWVRGDRDLGLTLTLGSGVIMSYLMAIRYFASPYLRLAEGLGWSFLSRTSGSMSGGPPSPASAPAPGPSDLSSEDLVIGMRFGDEPVGALVLRLEPNPSSSTSSSRRRNRGGSGSLNGGRGVIRAWTTALRYRRRGLGGDMLRAAVRLTRDRCGRDAEVGFAKEHANSVMVLPSMFNGPFRRAERKAAMALNAILAEMEGSRRKR